MKRELSREILKLGVPIRIRAIEDELEELHVDFPEFFLGHTPPRILRPELKNGTKPHVEEEEEERSTPTPERGKAWKKKQNNRRTTAKWLDKIADAPRRTVHKDTLRKWGMDLRGVSSLVNAGHLTRKGDVFTRTRTTFIEDIADYGRAKRDNAKAKKIKTKPSNGKPKVKGKLTYKQKKIMGRQRSADLLTVIGNHSDGVNLEGLKAVLPQGTFAGALAPLVRRGYLKHADNLYYRTAKPFEVEVSG